MALGHGESAGERVGDDYILALDGLRAVAVTLVLLFHVGFETFRGGFVGVDVFFVLSGFLITRNIARELERGRWSFSSFYARRVARILPALFVTVLASIAAGIFILSPEDLERLGRVGLYVTASASNIFFWLESGYFDQATQSKPLLHTWSLGVEEQFYLVWPLIIFGLYRWKGLRAGLIGLSAMAVVSFVAALVVNNEHPSAVFFLTPFRIYQFAFGGILALAGPLKEGISRTAAGWIGVAIVCAVGVTANGEDANLWLNAFSPALAAAAFIWSAKSRSIRAVFASPAFVWVGQRSYAIYLVHWPIVVLWAMASDYELSTGEGVAALAASVAAGAALHVLVEKPLRFRSLTSQTGRARRLAAAAALAFVCLFSGAHLWGLHGLPARVPEALRDMVAQLPDLWAERRTAVREGVCNFPQNHNISKYNVGACARPPEGARAYIVIGDSHGADTYMLMKMAYPEVYFGQLTVPGCLLLPPSPKRRNAEQQWCRERYARAFQVASSGRFDGVILASDWRSSYEDRIIDNLIKWAREHELDVVIMSHRPKFLERAPAIVSASISREAATQKAQHSMNPNFKSRAVKLRQRLDGTTKIVDMFEVLCPDGCPVFTPAGAMMYLDTNHLSVEGAQWAAGRLAKVYPDLLEDSRAVSGDASAH